ncbi:MAG: hypothetical protein N3A60_07595 [Thermanaerothrix sp.]|nr:hypothetical protein [Thermanaerothrix sp.]
MKRQFSLWVGIGVLVVVALACNLPVGGGQPTAQPTPNATLTALFALLTPVATTPPPVVASPTLAPPHGCSANTHHRSCLTNRHSAAAHVHCNPPITQWRQFQGGLFQHTAQVGWGLG